MNEMEWEKHVQYWNTWEMPFNMFGEDVLSKYDRKDLLKRPQYFQMVYDPTNIALII